MGIVPPWIAVLALMAATGCATTEPVGLPSRLCALPEVIRGVRTELQNRHVAGELDARNPGELTSADGSSARCSVWLIQPATNTNLLLPHPELRVSVQMYAVRRLSNSLAVDLID